MLHINVPREPELAVYTGLPFLSHTVLTVSSILSYTVVMPSMVCGVRSLSVRSITSLLPSTLNGGTSV